MLDSYFDEGGTETGAIIVVSGIVGSSSLMHKLARDWNKTLMDYQLESWRTKLFRSRKATMFRHLSLSQRKTIVIQLVEMINQRTLIGVTTVLNQQEYLSLTSPSFRSQWGSPYCFAVQMTLLQLSERLSQLGRDNEPINILLEEGNRNAKQTLDHIGRMKSPSAVMVLNLHEYGLGGKKQNPVLQAADMLAYSSFEEHRKLKRKPEIFGRLVAAGPSRRPDYLWLDCTREHIELAKLGIETLFREKRLGRILLHPAD